MTSPGGAAPERTPLARRPVFWLLLVIFVLAGALAVLLGAVFGAPRDPGGGAADASRSVPSESPSPSPVTPSPEPGEQPETVAIPDSCEGIYTRDWAAELEGLALNPAWSEEPDAGPWFAGRDEEVRAALEAADPLICLWLTPEGASDAGIVTNIARVDAAQTEAMIARLGELGQNCYEELEGTRCVIEESTDEGSAGESHFFREGIWSATIWANYGPAGYTQDIVETIFG